MLLVATFTYIIVVASLPSVNDLVSGRELRRIAYSMEQGALDGVHVRRWYNSAEVKTIDDISTASAAAASGAKVISPAIAVASRET